MGPADEFRPLGYDAAKPGGTFVKIGVGMLKRTDEKAYGRAKEDFASSIGAPSRSEMVNRKPIEMSNRTRNVLRRSALFQP
jgi:hypothetical protein